MCDVGRVQVCLSWRCEINPPYIEVELHCARWELGENIYDHMSEEDGPGE